MSVGIETRTRRFYRQLQLWWRGRGPVVLVRTVRLTAAAVLAYLVALAVSPGSLPLTGPLTALLVVQATLYSTLRMGLLRVGSVVSGVLVAVFLSDVVGLTWWSLGIVVAASLVIGQMLRLGEQLLEAPISAMLILGVPAASSAATVRVDETLVGAAIGVLINVVFPPGVRSRSAGRAVEDVAARTAEVLARAAHDLPREASREQALQWLDDVRSLSKYVDAADQAIVDLRDSRRLNPRAIREVDTEPILRSGLDALERTVVLARALFRSIADGLREEDQTLEYSPELFGAIGLLLEDLAKGIRAYGALVRADAEKGGEASDSALSEALDALHETRAVLTELLIVDAGKNEDHWMLSGTLLASVSRILRELDLEERARQRERWEAQTAARRASLRRMSRLRGTSPAGYLRASRRRTTDR